MLLFRQLFFKLFFLYLFFTYLYLNNCTALCKALVIFICEKCYIEQLQIIHLKVNLETMLGRTLQTRKYKHSMMYASTHTKAY